ncbi:uncharacterized protein LOC135217909 [Macrobrachium nipponense]|uniref:uncharacterized protein LOC135217909 n=1 Tax=Macrobrachium nipponense TaxID=159736 RepID=UPI0030C82F5E
MPLLAEQFDEVMKEYRNVRRQSQEGFCVHTAPADSSQGDATGSSIGEDDKVCDEEKSVMVSDNEDKAMDIEDEKLKGNGKKTLEGEEKSSSDGCLLDKDLSQAKATGVTSLDDCSCSVLTQGGKLASNIEVGIYGKPLSPGVTLPCPQNSGSVSCSPHSHHSSTESDQNSPTWSPAQSKYDSPPSSPPANHFVTISAGQCPWESPPSSRHSSPCSSPSYFPPWLSPPRSASPIKAPSDWEYEEDDVDESCENGRFSPVIPKAKDLEETEDEIDDVDEGDATTTEDVNTEDENVSADEDSAGREEGAIESHIKKMLVISPTSQKRSRETSSPCCSNVEVDSLEKKMKTGVEICSYSTDIDDEGKEASLVGDPTVCKSHCSDDTVKADSKADISKPDTDEASSEIESGPLKTPFIRMNEIKFRVRKRPRRKLSMDPDSNTSQDLPSQVGSRFYFIKPCLHVLPMLLCHLEYFFSCSKFFSIFPL